MSNERKFYRCQICGNLVGLIEDGSGELTCCGEAMAQIGSNTTDASKEKHVPVVKLAKGSITVEVGSTPHPMTEEHHIDWIAVVSNDATQRVQLEKTGEAKASFCGVAGPSTVYAYCNIHGLWSVEVK